MNDGTKNNTFRPEAYNQRDIAGLTAVHSWSSDYETLQLEHNRILQPGFLSRDPKEVVKDAKLAKEAWITDICCPSTTANLTIHIGAALVTKYMVAEEELGTTTKKALEFLTQDPNFATYIETKVRTSINNMLSKSGELSTQKLNERIDGDIMKKNEALKSKNLTLIDINDNDIRLAVGRIIIDQEMRKISDNVIKESLESSLAKVMSNMGISEKTHLEHKDNQDFVFLGAAGSGKSTISRLHINSEQKKDYATIATDNYRAIYIPGTESHEAKETKDVFIRTQDMAYMVKEQVYQNLQGDKRPNIIFDGVTLERETRALLSGNKNTKSMIAAYSGEPGFVGIAERAHNRALDPNAAPADKGRFANTTALLGGHAKASADILSNIPKGVITEVYSTNVERGEKPTLIAKIDESNKKIEVYDLRQFAEFVNKSNINAEAVNPLDLIMPKAQTSKQPQSKEEKLEALRTQKTEASFATTPDKKAESLANLTKSGYSVELMDQKGIAYASITQKEGEIVMDKTQPKTFIVKFTDKSIEADILKALNKKSASEKENVAPRNTSKKGSGLHNL